MLIVWLATVAGCICLALELLFQGHYIRYGWLLASAVLSVIFDAYFSYVKHFHHSAYLPSRAFVFFLFLGINGLVIIEAWRWSNRYVRIPTEVQTVLGIALLMLRKYGSDPWVVYYMDCLLRVTNLLMILAFLVLFSRTPSQLREKLDEPRTQPRCEAEEA